MFVVWSCVLDHISDRHRPEDLSPYLLLIRGVSTVACKAASETTSHYTFRDSFFNESKLKMLLRMFPQLQGLTVNSSSTSKGRERSGRKAKACKIHAISRLTGFRCLRYLDFYNCTMIRDLKETLPGAYLVP